MPRPRKFLEPKERDWVDNPYDLETSLIQEFLKRNQYTYEGELWYPQEFKPSKTPIIGEKMRMAENKKRQIRMWFDKLRYDFAQHIGYDDFDDARTVYWNLIRYYEIDNPQF